MKILKLRLKNLNSLYGEWEIDFTSKEFSSNGIFAITGSTGAGKSTVLDAICLALYGATPRLGSVNKSSNEIMSRKTGECFSEVLFRVNSKEFLSHWSQHRGRRSPDGNLMESKHEISEVIDGKGVVLGTKKREVLDIVVDKTGMDLERFTRSILLAQGSFSAFLQATADERAPILEQITGTEIYSQISKNIHEKQKEESEKYSLFMAEMDGFSILSSEDEEALNSELELSSERFNRLKIDIDRLQKIIIWNDKILSLKNDLELIMNSENSLLKQSDDFKPKRAFLKMVEKAYELDGEWAIYSDLETRAKSNSSLLESMVVDISKLDSLFIASETKLLEEERKFQDLKDSYKIDRVKLKEVRNLDYGIAQLKKELNEEGEISYEKEKLIRDEKIKLDNFVKIKKELMDECLVVNSYLEESRDGELVLSQSGIKLQLESYKESESSLSDKGIDIKKSSDKIASLIYERDKKQKIHALLVEKKSGIQALIDDKKLAIEKELDGKLLREFRNELSSLLKQKALMDKISSLEAEREKLINGSPCPLCGATEHPFSTNIMKESNESERINRVESIIAWVENCYEELEQLEKSVNEALKGIVESEKDILTYEIELKELTKAVDLKSTELGDIKKKVENIERSLFDNLRTFGIDFTSVENVIKQLESKVLIWEVNKQKSSEFSLKLMDLEHNIERSHLEIKKLEEEVLIKNRSLAEKTVDLDKLKALRVELFDLKDPDEYEKETEGSIALFEKKINELRSDREGNKTRLVELESKFKTVKADLELIEQDFSKVKFNLEDLFKSLGFSSIANFLEHRISPDERRSLTFRENEINSQLATVISKKLDLESQLKSEIEKNISSRPLADINNDLGILSRESQTLGEKIGGFKQQLKANSETLSKLDEKRKDIDKQKIEMENWQKLHSLIGSADGKKFRNFAQGLTFEQMVVYANRELVKLSDRYLLIRDVESPLDLNVIDNYQAGEIRSTKNLSGGESFIISLALALGLSHMSSSRVRVDSLFLDEGFGTLDEETLELALDTLSSLHQSGKIIGVISHVPALKQSISTQITIEKGSGGRSKIRGPGCRLLI